MPKQNRETAFSLFMKDFKKRKELAGKKFTNGLKDVRIDPECNEEWKALTIKEKNYYKILATEKSDTNNYVTVQKQTCTPTFADDLAWEQEDEDFLEHMEKDIRTTIKKAGDANEICNQNFFLIHVHYYYVKHGTNYVPCEVAISRFNLKSGVTDMYHNIMKCKREIGYKRDCLAQTEAVHGIPDDYNGDDDWKTIFEKILDFIAPNGENNLPPLYTIEKLKPVVNSFIKKLADTNGENPNFIPVYFLENLFFNLHKQIWGINVRLNNQLTINKLIELERCRYESGCNLMCEFHIPFGDGKYDCSKKIVQYWVFYICAKFCQKFHIFLAPGSHKPVQIEKNPVSIQFGYDQLITRAKMMSMTNVSSDYKEKKSSKAFDVERRRINKCEPRVTYFEEVKQEPGKKAIYVSENQTKPSDFAAKVAKGKFEAKTFLGPSTSTYEPNFPTLGSFNGYRFGSAVNDIPEIPTVEDLKKEERAKGKGKGKGKKKIKFVPFN